MSLLCLQQGVEGKYFQFLLLSWRVEPGRHKWLCAILEGVGIQSAKPGDFSKLQTGVFLLGALGSASLVRVCLISWWVFR